MQLHIFQPLSDYCPFTTQARNSRCPGINVIVWSVKYKISIRWHSFMSLSNPDGAIFYSAWFKYPSIWVCLQLNHPVNVQQPEKNLVFLDQWDKKQGDLLTPGRTTPDIDCKWYYMSVRAPSATSKQRRQYNYGWVLPCVRKLGVFLVL